MLLQVGVQNWVKDTPKRYLAISWNTCKLLFINAVENQLSLVCCAVSELFIVLHHQNVTKGTRKQLR